MDVHTITTITSAELLQANVTIIAGILVLLTISIVGQKQNLSKFLGDPLAFIAFSPIFFIASITFLMLGSVIDPNLDFYYLAGSASFVVGLGYLFITILAIVVTIVRNKN